MPGCRIDHEASPQFKKLCEHWRRTYPHIHSDLEDAFQSIRQNINAKDARRYQGTSALEVYKYRQNSKDIRRGARYGWRIYCLYEKERGILYPIFVYPKPALANASDSDIKAAIREVREVLGYCVIDGCSGFMKPVEPMLFSDESSTRVRCTV